MISVISRIYKKITQNSYEQMSSLFREQISGCQRRVGGGFGEIGEGGQKVQTSSYKIKVLRI